MIARGFHDATLGLLWLIGALGAAVLLAVALAVVIEVGLWLDQRTWGLQLRHKANRTARRLGTRRR